MSNPFGGFSTNSPLSPHSHSPLHDICSNCIRDYFGPLVQTVADCLHICGSASYHEQMDTRFSSTSISFTKPLKPSTLMQILPTIRRRCERPISQERHRLVRSLKDNNTTSNNEVNNFKKIFLKRTKGNEECGYIADTFTVHASLIVLLHHGIVRALPTRLDACKPKSPLFKYGYVLDAHRALCLPRYSRYIEYIIRKYDHMTSVIVEELLVRGRMESVEIVERTITSVTKIIHDEKTYDKETNETEFSIKHICHQENMNEFKYEKQPIEKNEHELEDTEVKLKSIKDGIIIGEEWKKIVWIIVDRLKSLINAGFVCLVSPLLEIECDKICNNSLRNNKNVPLIGRKRCNSEIYHDLCHQTYCNIFDCKKNADINIKSELASLTDKNPPYNIIHFIESVLSFSSNHKTFPPGAVWTVNIKMFQLSLRSLCLGRLVSERYGNAIPDAGAVTTAALQFSAQRKYDLNYRSGNNGENLLCTFTPKDLIPVLPVEVLFRLRNKEGGVLSNLTETLLSLSTCVYPPTVSELDKVRREDNGDGHVGGFKKFEICVDELMRHLKGRIVSKVVRDRYGTVAARICAILETNGYLECDAIAEYAMIPVKDARIILHTLYKSNYVVQLNQQQGKHHNSGTAIYLWTVLTHIYHASVHDDICRVYCNLQRRRQHQSQVGKEWFQRALNASEIEENDNVEDRKRYEKFSVGLERLDIACLQTDDTLNALRDFM